MMNTNRLLRTIVALAAAMASYASALAADNPFAPNQVTSSDTVTWRKKAENSWQLEGATVRPVMGDFGRMVGVASGKKLIVLNADGTPEPEIVVLPKEYRFLGLRKNYLVGIPVDSSEIEFLDRSTGKELRRASLRPGKPLAFQLHPTLPVAYVSLSRQIPVNEKFSIKGLFVAVDELKAEVRSSDDNIGQTFAIDPSGRFMVAGYSDLIELGSELVGSGEFERFQLQPGSPLGPALPRGYGGGRPRGPMSPGSVIIYERAQRVTKAARISLMILYDLEQESVPRSIGAFEFRDFARGLRLSYDGRHLTGLGSNLVIESRNPLDPKAAAVTYDAGTVGFGTAGTELVHHPVIPISVIVAADKIDFLATKTGRPLADTGASTVALGNVVSDRYLAFSADGKQVLIAEGSGGAGRLVRFAIPLDEELKKRLEERNATTPAGPIAKTLVPLARFDALRGGLAPEMRASEITKRFSRSVVVVKSNEGSGTGFVVGSSGYILTCAHCVSRLTPTVVAYRTPSGSEESEAEAVVLQRDADQDLALLKITPTEPLTSVLLAPPIDTSHGEEVTVISNPVLGDTVLKSTVTTGVVSHASQLIEKDLYIQSSASVNPGSSGGPMFDQHGRTIGMVVLKARIDGVGFAVPARRITEFLLRSASFIGDEGRLMRKWIDAAQRTEQVGTLVKFQADKLTIAPPGAAAQDLPVDRLSEGDREFLKFLNAAMIAPAPTPASTPASAVATP